MNIEIVYCKRDFIYRNMLLKLVMKNSYRFYGQFFEKFTKSALRTPSLGLLHTLFHFRYAVRLELTSREMRSIPPNWNKLPRTHETT